MGRILGIDFGTKRVGLAVSDPRGLIATPLEVYLRRDAVQDARHFQYLVDEHEVERIVVGLPVHLDGREGASASLVRTFGAWLGRLTGLPVLYYDERFTTSDAEKSLIAAGLKRSKRKDLRDMLAARLLLQNYLDDGCPEVPARAAPIDDPTPEPAGRGVEVTTLVVGCGYLGTEVARRLVARGERVLGTTRSAVRGGWLRAQAIEPVVADVLEPESLRKLPRADRVLYCVGHDRAVGLPMRTVFVGGLTHALEALAGRFGHLVYASATSVYGQTDGGWVDEDSPTVPREESGRVCLEAETLAREFAVDRGLSLSIVRYSGLYGPGRIIRRKALEQGEPIAGDPLKWLNLVHIDDAAAAAVAALDRGAAGRVYLATDDRPVTREEYYSLAARCLGAPAPRFVPAGQGGHRPATAASKRVSNRRIKDELGVRLAFPDVTTGLPAAITVERGLPGTAGRPQSPGAGSM
jgi:putative transcription antitermination factor YqgF